MDRKAVFGTIRMLLFLVLVSVFIAGCAEQGTKVIQISPNGQPSAPAAAPSPAPLQNSTVQNTTAPAPQAAVQPQAAPANANLQLESFLLSAINAKPNENFDVIFKVKNTGTDTISSFDYSVRIMKGSSIVKSDSNTYTQTISPGNSSKIVLTYALSDIGTYDVILNISSMGGSQKINILASSNSTAFVSGGTGSCTDSDGGKSYNVQGTCTDGSGQVYTDLCPHSNTLWEYYCDANQCKSEPHNCSCSKGSCNV